MLKSMRKNLKSLKPILWIVVATFIIAIFAIWGGAGRLGETKLGDTIATVGGEKVSRDEYLQTLEQRLEAMKKQYPGLTAGLIQQLNIPLDTLAQIVQRRLLVQVAREMGLSATDQEVKQKIISFPVFQRDGAFVGYEDYRRILEYNHIPLAEFESGLRQDILVEKAIQIITAGVSVTDEEAWASYRKEQESAKLDYLVAEADKTEPAGKPSEEELRARLAAEPDRYKIPEKRSGDYVFIKTEDLKKEVKVEDADIEKYYRENRAQFEEPEKVRVSRIWLPAAAAAKDAVRKQAGDILARLRAGQDFAALAGQFSKDDKAASGGDWGYTDWMSLDADEQKAIRGLEAGQLSEPVETAEGFALLKVTEKTPAAVKPLDSVKDVIKRVLEDEKARDLVSSRIQRLEKVARKEKNLDLAAQKEGLKASSTGPLKSGDPLADLDSTGAVSQALFALKPNEISAPVYTYTGAALLQLREVVPERPAEFEEARAQLEADLLKEKKMELAREKLLAVKADLKTDWPAAATKNKLEFKTVEAHKREQYLSLVGENPEVDDLIFSVPLNQPSEPVRVETGYALFRVLERKSADRAEFEKNKAQALESLLAQKRNAFLQSYMTHARAEKKVQVNYDLFLKLNSDILARYTGE